MSSSSSTVMYRKGKMAAVPPRKPYRLSIPRPQRRFERAKVLFSYDAENEDELTLEEGSIITVIDKDLEDSGWWKGEINGKVGVFPDNFVSLVPNEEKPKKPPPPQVPENRRGRPLSQVSVDKPEPVKAVKREEHKEEPKGIRRKPAQLPPPKKGNKADLKLIAQTDDMKAQEQVPDDQEGSFAGTESSDPKLNHPTVARVKAPVRRPPGGRKPEEDDDSAFLSDEDSSHLANSDLNPTPNVPERYEKNQTQGNVYRRPVPLPPTRDQALPKAPQPPPVVHSSRPEKAPLADTKTVVQSQNKPEKALAPLSSSHPHPHTGPANPALARPPPPKSAPPPPISPPPALPDTDLGVEEEVQAYLAQDREEKKEMPPPPRAARPPPPTPSNREDTRATSPPVAPRSQDIKDTSQVNGAVDPAIVEELQKEIKFLRANTVHRDDFNSIQKDLQHMREDMDKLRTMFNKKVLDLMKEVDEEKKTRLNMQVEIDRLRKLVVPDDDL